MRKNPKKKQRENRIPMSGLRASDVKRALISKQSMIVLLYKEGLITHQLDAFLRSCVVLALQDGDVLLKWGELREEKRSRLTLLYLDFHKKLYNHS